MKFVPVLLLSLGLGLLPAQQLTFSSSRIPVDPSPLEVRTGDFNKDGIQDIAVLCPASILILLGKGDGTFQAPVRTVTGLYYDLEVADFNHDGKADLVAIYGGFQSVEGHTKTPIDVFIGNGDGTFAAPVSYTLPPLDTDYTMIGVADVNGDGNPDLVTVNFVLLGKGDGSFGPPITTALFSTPSDSFALADFNGDGKADILFSSIQEMAANYPVGLAFGQASGNFGTPDLFTAARDPFATVFAGDFDGDGKTDALLNESGGTVSVFLGRGDGTFRIEKTTAGAQVYVVATGDLNGDGTTDLVALTFGAGVAGVLLSNGDGTFHSAGNFNLGTPGQLFVGYPPSLALADFNGDGKLDMVAANTGSDDISILINTTIHPGITSAVNAASSAKGQAVAGGSLATFFGAGLSSATSPAYASAIPLPTLLGGTSVTINDTPAPLLYVSSTQINLQIPWLVSGTASVVVTVNGVSLPAFSLSTASAAPGVFSTSSGQAIAINPDGSFAGAANSIPGTATHPAVPGEVLVVLATGLGAVTPSIGDGVAASDGLRTVIDTPQVLIGGMPATVQFAGLSPQFVGLNQLNIVVPKVSGTVPLQISAGGITSTDQVTISVAKQ